MNPLLSDRKFGVQKFLTKCTGGGNGCTLTSLTTTSESKWWLEPKTQPACKKRDDVVTSWRFHRTNIVIPCPANLPGDAVGIPNNERGFIRMQSTRWVRVFKELTCTTAAKMGDSTATVKTSSGGTPCTCKCKTNCNKPSDPVLVTGQKSLEWAPPKPPPTPGPNVDYKQTGENSEYEEYKDREIYWCESRTNGKDPGPGRTGKTKPPKPATTLTYQVQTMKYEQKRTYAYATTTTCSCGPS
jgi:hypothetical protein